MMHSSVSLTNWKTSMFYKINFSMAAIFLACLMISSCALNTGSQYSARSSGPAEYPSKLLLAVGVDIQNKHSFKELQSAFYNKDITENSLNSEAYLHLFLTDSLSKKCVWYLSKWHLDEGLLAYQLECDTNFGEILFKGKLTGNKYQINDIYSHKYGFWLSELVTEQLSNPADFKLWQAAMNEIRDIEYGSGRARVVASKLEQLQDKSFFSEILEIKHSPKSSKVDNLLVNNFVRLLTISSLHPQYPNLWAMNLSSAGDDYDTALAILDKIESKVGQSKMTLLHRSWFHYKQGDLSQAYHYAIYAHKFGVHSVWASYYLTRYSIETKQYDEALELLKIQFNTSDWSDAWIAEFDNGKEFINLPSYKKWRKQS